MKVYPAIDAFIGPLFPTFPRLTVNERYRPKLELMLVKFEQTLGAVYVERYALDDVMRAAPALHSCEATFNNVNGKGCNIYPDPIATKLFGGFNGSTAATKWV